MLGLACADHGRPGFGDDLHRRIARALEDFPVVLAGVSVPARRASDIYACLFIFDQVSAAVKLPENSGGETLDVCRAGTVSKETALEADHALVDIVRVTRLFSYDQFTRVELRVGGDETLLTGNGYHLRYDLVFFI